MLKVAETHTEKKSAPRSLKEFSELASVEPQKFSATRFLSEGSVKLTGHEAKILLDETRYDRQVRDLTTSGADHISVLADIMGLGRWRPKEKIDFARLPGGKMVLVNGHHRLAAQALANIVIEWVVVIHDCRDEEAVSDLYRSFDTNVRMRGVNTILDVSGVGDKIGISRTTAAALYRAVPLIEMDFNPSLATRSPIIHRVIDRRFERMTSFQREIVAWENATDRAPTKIKKRLSTQGALAVALLTFRYHPTDAMEFWGGVASDDGLRKGDPRHSYLRVLNDDNGRGSVATTLGYAAAAWNAFYEGRQGAFIKLSSGPIRIAGTPIGRK